MASRFQRRLLLIRQRARVEVDWGDAFAIFGVIAVAVGLASLLDDNAWAWLVFGIYGILLARSYVTEDKT